MKIKKVRMCVVSILYIFMMGLVFNTMSLIRVNAQGFNFTVLNEANTAIQNKYDIKGEIFSAKMYSDCKVIVTSYGIYTIKNDKLASYTKCEPSFRAIISRNDKNVFVTPVIRDYTTEEGYLTAKIDLNTNVVSYINQFSKYLHEDILYETGYAFVDSNNNQWFSAIGGTDYYTDTYYGLFRASSNGATKLIRQYSKDEPCFYEDLYTNIKEDSMKNVYYTVAQSYYNEDNYNITDKVYKVERVNTEGIVTSFKFKNRVTDYVVSDSGDIWSIVGTNELNHIDKSGKLIATFPLTKGKSITLDSSNNIYVFDDNTFKKIENNILKKVVSLGSFESKCNDISIIDEKNYLINNVNSMVINIDAKPEYSVIDSYIGVNPNVIKDNLGNVFIMSQSNNYFYETYLKILKINTDGTQEFSRIEQSEVDLYKIRAYNGELYVISYNNIIYKINGEQKEVYEKVDIVGADEGNGISIMEMDNLGAIYLVDYSHEKMLKINQDKSKVNYNFSAVKAENGGYDWLQNILVDKYNNVFLIPYMNYFNSNSNLYIAKNTGEVEKIETSTIDIYNSSFKNVFLDQNNQLNVIPNSSMNDYILNGNLKFVINTELNGDSALYDAQKVMKLGDENLILKNYSGVYIKSPADSKFVDKSENITGVEDLGWISNIEVDNLGRIYLDTNGNIYVSPPIIFNFHSIKEDTNNDGLINIVDLNAAASNYNTKGSSANWEEIEGNDVNGDKIIDIFDLVMISKNIK